MRRRFFSAVRIWWKLAPAVDHACELLLGFGGGRLGMGLHNLREVRQVVGVDAIGLRQATVGPDEGANAARVDDGDRQLAGAELAAGCLLVAAGGFEDDEGRVVVTKQGSQLPDTLGVIVEAPGPLAATEGEIQVVLSGGASVAIYRNHKYVSKDIDFVDRYSLDHKAVREAMQDLGFERAGKHYRHPDTE